MTKVLEVLSPWSDLFTAVICVCVIWLLLRRLGVQWSDVTNLWKPAPATPATTMPVTTLPPASSTAGFAGSYSSSWMNPNMNAVNAV